MKGHLEFSLPEEREEFKVASEAQQWKMVVEDMDNWLRSQMKYQSDGYSGAELALIERIRTRLTEIMTEEGLELYE